MSSPHERNGDWEPVENDRQILAALLVGLAAIAIVTAVVFGLEAWFTFLLRASICFAALAGFLTLALRRGGKVELSDSLAGVMIFWLLVGILSVIVLWLL